jgi:nucleoside-diphosphate-sugar epimerase
MNILITGIHGFVGTNLVAALKSKHTIYGLDIVAPEKEGVIKTFSWNDVGALRATPLLEFDAIIHLAGKAHDTKNKSDEKIYFDVNVGLTKIIFDYFLQSTAKQFIFFSSVKAAADKVDGDFLTENVVPQPVGAYGESKIAAEKYILSHTVGALRATPLQERDVFIFRPCMIHGRGNKGNLNLLYNVVSRGIPYPLGAFDNQRSFMNIVNLAYIVEQFILQSPSSGIYHLADDEPLSTNELIELIAKSKNKKPRIWKINKSLVKFIAKVGTFCCLPLNEDRLQKLTENYVVSNQKMKNALKINNLPVDVREGLRQTLETF